MTSLLLWARMFFFPRNKNTHSECVKKYRKGNDLFLPNFHHLFAISIAALVLLTTITAMVVKSTPHRRWQSTILAFFLCCCWSSLFFVEGVASGPLLGGAYIPTTDVSHM
jgi:hypothetical protein